MTREVASRIETMGRLERKLLVPSHFEHFMIAWLHHNCMADPLHPSSLVSSLYLDTPELEAYNECLNGDNCKSKVRLRWYDAPAPDGNATAYIEVKSKTGFYTLKRRREVNVSGQLLNAGRFIEIAEQLDLFETLPELGCLQPKPLRPVIVIAYSRYRFLDLLGGMTLTLDTNITSRMVEKGRSGWGPQLKTPAVILELKGGTMELTHALSDLNDFSPRWVAFSKYAQCLESHLEV